MPRLAVKLAACLELLNSGQFTDVSHWRCLNDSMWSTFSAVQVVSWRILNRLRSEAWAQDLLDIFYLDEELLDWAHDGWTADAKELSHDNNGAILQAGDSVTVIKDLDVRGKVCADEKAGSRWAPNAVNKRG